MESFILAVATEDGHDVPAREGATASESKYGCELFGDKRRLEIRRLDSQEEGDFTLFLLINVMQVSCSPHLISFLLWLVVYRRILPQQNNILKYNLKYCWMLKEI